MATAASRSRRVPPPVQQSSGWPLSGKQTVLIFSVGVLTLAGCVTAFLFFTDKDRQHPADVGATVAATFLLPSSMSALLNHRDINATGQSATALLKASPAELSRSLATWKDQWVDWEVGVHMHDAAGKIMALAPWASGSSLYLLWEGTQDGLVPMDSRVLNMQEMVLVNQHVRYQERLRQNHWDTPPPMFVLRSVQLKARITRALVQDGRVIVHLADWKRSS